MKNFSDFLNEQLTTMYAKNQTKLQEDINSLSQIDDFWEKMETCANEIIGEQSSRKACTEKIQKILRDENGNYHANTNESQVYEWMIKWLKGSTFDKDGQTYVIRKRRGSVGGLFTSIAVQDTGSESNSDADAGDTVVAEAPGDEAHVGAKLSHEEIVDEFVKCRVPDDCIDSRRCPLFVARAVMQGLIEQLRSEGVPTP